MFYNRSGYPLALAFDDTCLDGEVCVYKKLTATKTVDGSIRNLWSVCAVKGNDQRGTVLCYADRLVLTGCRAVVAESRRKVIESGGYREVCAWFIGRLSYGTQDYPPQRLIVESCPRVTFRPRERGEFFRTDNGDAVFEADAMLFGRGGDAWLMS